MNAARALKFELSFENEDLVLVKLNDSVVLEEQDILEINERRKALTQGRKHYVLVLAGEYTSATREAVLFGKSLEFSKDKLGEAIVVNSLAQRILGNFFVRISKSKMPLRLFSDEYSAREWLKSLKHSS